MNATPRGWCPGVHQPMSMPDGLMVRVKPHAGVLPPLAASALAKAAAREGCAAILLTSRANFQLRGLTAAGAARFAAAMVACGLADADPGLERRRNLIVSPLAGADPAVDPATRPIADAIAAGLRDAVFEGLPDKFGFVRRWRRLPAARRGQRRRAAAGGGRGVAGVAGRGRVVGAPLPGGGCAGRGAGAGAHVPRPRRPAADARSGRGRTPPPNPLPQREGAFPAGFSPALAGGGRGRGASAVRPRPAASSPLPASPPSRGIPPCA